MYVNCFTLTDDNDKPVFAATTAIVCDKNVFAKGIDGTCIQKSYFRTTGACVISSTCYDEVSNDPTSVVFTQENLPDRISYSTLLTLQVDHGAD